MDYRIGFGMDFHALKEGSEFRIGGVHVPHHKGAYGYSDADVLLHAICDALLGATNLGDIGDHFPDSDPEFKNIDSTILVQRTLGLVRGLGFQVVNVDSMLCLQEPKIKPYIPSMQHAISTCSGIPMERISIKATTTERLGFVGREEGVVAYATVLLSRQ